MKRNEQVKAYYNFINNSLKVKSLTAFIWFHLSLSLIYIYCPLLFIFFSIFFLIRIYIIRLYNIPNSFLKEFFNINTKKVLYFCLLLMIVLLSTLYGLSIFYQLNHLEMAMCISGQLLYISLLALNTFHDSNELVLKFNFLYKTRLLMIKHSIKKIFENIIKKSLLCWLISILIFNYMIHYSSIAIDFINLFSFQHSIGLHPVLFLDQHQLELVYEIDSNLLTIKSYIILLNIYLITSFIYYWLAELINIIYTEELNFNEFLLMGLHDIKNSLIQHLAFFNLYHISQSNYQLKRQYIFSAKFYINPIQLNQNNLILNHILSIINNKRYKYLCKKNNLLLQLKRSYIILQKLDDKNH